MLEKLCWRAALAKFVAHADSDDRNREVFGEEFADGAAHAAGDLGFLDCYDGAAVFGGVDNSFRIEGFDGGAVNDAGCNAELFEIAGGKKRFVHLRAAGDDGNIGAFGKDLSFTHLKWG